MTDDTELKAKIEALIAARIAARTAKDFAESDRLRAEIVGLGATIMDAKDPITGELSTVWEIRKPKPTLSTSQALPPKDAEA